MKVWRKFTAVALVFVMMLAMSATALAANPKTDNQANTSGGIEANSDIAAENNTIQIAKSIVFINAQGSKVREPNITYTYTLTAASPSSAQVTGVTEGNGAEMTTTVKEGVIQAVSGYSSDRATDTVAFADTNSFTASSTGASNTKYATFTFNPTNFTDAGIYRYQIVESQSPAKASVGIVASRISAETEYNNTRFLDVYVKWNSGHTAREIYGYVLFEGTEDDSLDYDNLADKLKKSQGYVNTSDDGQTDVDVYSTTDLYISGTTTGALADKNWNFPISINLAKPDTLTAVVKLIVETTGNGVVDGTATDETHGNYVTMNTLSGTLRDGSTITLKGIPVGSTVNLTERNNTPDSYLIKIGTASGGHDKFAEEPIAANGSTAAFTTAIQLTGQVSLFITNTLEAISPTGVTLRFAPYFAMLGAGVVALPLSIRRKREDF